MQFRNCTVGDIESAIARANREGGYELYWDGGMSLRGRILPASGRVKGARRSHSGRRIKATCWHGFRDVFIAFFEACPDGRVTTAMADYRGRASFYAQYEATGDREVGSMMEPRTYSDLCDCTDGNGVLDSQARLEAIERDIEGWETGEDVQRVRF